MYILLDEYGELPENGGFQYLDTLTPNAFANSENNLWAFGYQSQPQSYSHNRDDISPRNKKQRSLDPMEGDSVRSLPRDSNYRALEPDSNCSTQFIGFSSESDPFLLNHFPYDENHEVRFFQVTYRNFPTYVPPASIQSLSASAPIHFLQSQVTTASEGLRVVKGSNAGLNCRENLEAIVDGVTGAALLKL